MSALRRLAFLWRISSRSKVGNMKESNLPFEGFLEALVRLACLKAAPTDEELVNAGCANAYQFLTELQLHDPGMYSSFLEVNAAPWGEAPRQPVSRCIDHMVCIIIGTIEHHTSGGKATETDGNLSKKEVKAWCRDVQSQALGSMR